MITSKILPMIILVPLWVLDNAESMAVMKTSLGLAFTEPTDQRTAKIAQNDQGQCWGSTELSGLEVGSLQGCRSPEPE